MHHNVIDLFCLDHVSQPIHIRRKIFTFQTDADIDLIPVLLAQSPDAAQIILKLFPRIHPHMGTIGTGELPRAVIGKAQNLVAPSNSALDIFFIAARRMTASGSMGMKISFHDKNLCPPFHCQSFGAERSYQHTALLPPKSDPDKNP